MSEDGLQHFQQVDMRLGRIVAVDDFPEARKPAFKLTIDFGELGIRRSSAQITVYYAKDELVGRLVIAVVSLPPRRIAGFKSEVLVLGVQMPKATSSCWSLSAMRRWAGGCSRSPTPLRSRPH